MPAMSDRRPNILFILSDDQGAWAMGHAGTPELHTPVLDAMARRGKRLEALYCASPVCSPARASLMTGRIPSAHGVHDWIRAGNTVVEREFHNRLVDYLAGQPTYVQRLAEAGYLCGFSGKWHLGNVHQPAPGFAFWRPYATGGGSYHDPPMIDVGEVVREPGYVTDIITSHALHFLDEQTGEAPWYLSVHYTAPHSPWGEQEHLPEDYRRYFPNESFPNLPAPPMHPQFYDPAAFPADAVARRRLLAGYFAAMTAMDRNIGRMLARLEARGELGRTLVVFTSDNGMNMGHHGIYGKGNGTFPQNFFESSVRVPGLIMHLERLQPGVLRGICSHYDFAPTLLGYAGLEPQMGPNLPGRDLSALWLSETLEEDHHAVVFDEYGPNRMIRSGQWKFIQRWGAGGDELYDLQADPGESLNRIGDPAVQSVVSALQMQLNAWFERYADPSLDGRSLPVIGGGQIDRVGGEGVSGTVFVGHKGNPAPGGERG